MKSGPTSVIPRDHQQATARRLFCLLLSVSIAGVTFLVFDGAAASGEPGHSSDGHTSVSHAGGGHSDSSHTGRGGSEGAAHGSDAGRRGWPHSLATDPRTFRGPGTQGGSFSIEDKVFRGGGKPSTSVGGRPEGVGSGKPDTVGPPEGKGETDDHDHDDSDHEHEIDS